MVQISVINRSNTISDRELHRVIRAINRQVAEDFEPYWAFGGRLRLDGPTGCDADLKDLKELRGDAILYLLDTAAANDALGYHERNLSGIPCGFVFLDVCKQLGDEWSTALSHEALELIADPLCNLLVQGPHPDIDDRRVYHYFEMCDAVQAQSYEIDGVRVSNFVLPQYFSEGEREHARNDFCSSGLTAFHVNPGGYIGFFDPATNGNDKFFANDATAVQRAQIKGALPTSRIVRRTSNDGVPTARPADQQRQDATHQMASGAASGDPIRHVVVLMLENRSFDHMLGALRASFDAEIDGVDPLHPGVNIDNRSGASLSQTDNAQAWVGKQFKVPHEFADVATQLSGNLGNFVNAYRAANPEASRADLAQVMAYFKDGSLPVLHTLAKNFLVCDRWFSSLPGPTWPNRLFVHSGTSLGDVLMPDAKDPASIGEIWGRYTQATIYNRLDDARKSWKIYHDGFPQSVILDRLKAKFFGSAYAAMAEFQKDAAVGGNFPEYAFIEARYFDGPNGRQNDQHPPTGVQEGERLIATVYNTLRGNDALWKSTLLIILYDEHGGFYDHVAPPPTVAPDQHVTSTFSFQQLGVRVPAILVSPYVKRGVDHTVYDHTSILRYLCEKWQLPHLCRRTEPTPGVNVIGSFAHAVSLSAPRDDVPGPLPMPAAAADGSAGNVFDNAKESLLAFGEMLMRQNQPEHMAAAVGPLTEPAAGTPQQRAERLESWINDVKQ
ncbi:alkaline phosphatase family protein [Paraherbaspirillum soli]|uniref:Alkaline phosphatase family protein n=1 Tax=Paraherbaspirillum soli TaxID=631222 RepID=A0ABW0M5U4_9BURK